MSHRIGSIEIRKSRKKLVVQGLGKTPRGTKFIRSTTALAVTEIDDKAFKSQMAAAVEGMLAQDVLPL